MKRTATRISALFLVFVLCFTVITPALAANVCSGKYGYLTETKTFTITTGNKIFSSDKIVLKQTKGTTEQSNGFKRKNVGMYGRFWVSVYDNTDGKWIYKDQKWKDGTFTISGWKLKKKHSYTVTVRGDLNEYVLDTYDSSAFYSFVKWKYYPYWSVSKTGGNIVLCG